MRLQRHTEDGGPEACRSAKRMSNKLKALMICFLATEGMAVTLQSIPFKSIFDNRTFVRDVSDRRYNVWTDDSTKAQALASEFGMPQDQVIQLETGEVFAVFMNDNIAEDLVQLVYNSNTHRYFGDYADSGIQFRLRRLSDDLKYSHLTAVIFTPLSHPSHLGIRGMIQGGLSEKK